MHHDVMQSWNVRCYNLMHLVSPCFCDHTKAPTFILGFLPHAFGSLHIALGKQSPRPSFPVRILRVTGKNRGRGMQEQAAAGKISWWKE